MQTSETVTSSKKRISAALLEMVLVLSILGGAAFLRLRGLYWGEYQFLHPDERFLVWVGTDISPVAGLAEYFDTANSSLNPHNRGHGFYVYGTFPMFLARYLAEWQFGGSDWVEMTQVGRLLSALADLGTVLLVFLIARRLYGRAVGLLAMAFSAFTVLQIQQAHFFTMDTFTTVFSTLALYFAVVISTSRREDSLAWPVVGFGVALGMAAASKVNTIPVAATLPAAMFIYWLRLPEAERAGRWPRLVVGVATAAAISLLVFRVLQPYAFSGPGFFGLKPNTLWFENLRTQRAQASRDVDFPPAMQWARRPMTFSLHNMVLWGLGLPLGILAWSGFLWAGVRMFRSWNRDREESFSHALIWFWTAAYFAWQSIQINPTMRYQLPIYPTLAIFAAWAIVWLYRLGRGRTIEAQRPSADGDVRLRRALRAAAVVIGGVVLLATAAYAYAFAQIYTRPITRIEASRWIYENIPGPINLRIQTETGPVNQPIPFVELRRIAPERPFVSHFTPRESGTLGEIYLPRLRDEAQNPNPLTLRAMIFDADLTAEPLATSEVQANFDSTAQPVSLLFDPPVTLEAGRQYALALEVQGVQSRPFTSEAIATLFPAEDSAEPPVDQQMTPMIDPALQFLPQVQLELVPQISGWFSQLRLTGSGAENDGAEMRPDAHSLTIESRQPNGEASQSALTFIEVNADGDALFALDNPPQLNVGETYIVTLEVVPQDASIALSGMGVANEGEWDDGLPVRIDGYDGFGGIYPTDLNFNMYWDDNLAKYERFVRIMNQADYIVISSNRQWGSLPRLPERFPMTTLYYRNLLGCPAEMSIEDCYRTAEPGMFQGQLGFELIQVFTSAPTLGPLTLNDQFAEEAFTVYDHPKVLIFRRTENYDPRRTADLLGSVDFSRVVRVPPLRAGESPTTLLLPDDRWGEQQAGGTWSELFDSDALINRSQVVATVAWYLIILLLGWTAFPLLRMAAPGLHDRGYPLSRIAGMLLFAYLAWLAGSTRIPLTRQTLTLILAALIGLAAYLYYRDRKSILAELRERRTYLIVVEGLFLLLFISFLIVRLNNPDLWHPWKGGEKPMDFAYFNAVLKSTTFPPYDPWYGGGYLNYYYFGFVLVGMPVKLLGIVPSVAYNLILPTLFSLIAAGAFSAVWNLLSVSNRASLPDEDRSKDEIPPQQRHSLSAAMRSAPPYLPAIAAAAFTAIFGNLGTIRMIYQGFQRLAAPGGNLQDAGLVQLWLWGFEGFLKALTGTPLPYSPGDWYWLPSRAIPTVAGDIEPITEFPYFTVLYADLHAHLIALPLTLLALGLIIALVLGGGRRRGWTGAASWFGLTGLAIGALRPTNTWDMPTYLALAVVALVYTGMRNFRPSAGLLHRLPFLNDIPERGLRLGVSLSAGAVLAGLSILLFQPFAHWYALGYTRVAVWTGSTTSSYSYLIHWGLFLFVTVTWMAWETRDWMAVTPVSALRKLAPYRLIIQILLVLAVLAMVTLMIWKVSIAWIVIPLGLWAVVLLLRPDQADAKRIVLFLIGVGLMLTLMVEKVVLVGDIGRMNTVFKFYLQVWVLFAIAAAAGLGWLQARIHEWHPTWRFVWETTLTLLMFGAFLYTLTATMAKMEDRMALGSPKTLDGMAYMPYAAYTDEWGMMTLDQDYNAIRWLQENVEGSPVIVEANLRNLYRWGSRMSIYTGLPGVVGWEWHQQQQRAVTPGLWVTQRILEIDEFFQTEDLGRARDFLRKYNVRYIIVGKQERGHYPGPGLEKFEAADGVLWREVFRDGETVIYEVIHD